MRMRGRSAVDARAQGRLGPARAASPAVRPVAGAPGARARYNRAGAADPRGKGAPTRLGRARMGPVLASILLALAAFDDDPAFAQETTTFFDNTAHGVNSHKVQFVYSPSFRATVQSPDEIAQRIRTGNREEGYTLTAVGLRVWGGSFRQATLSLKKGSPIAETLATLNYSSESGLVITYTPASGVPIEPDTTYFVMIKPGDGSWMSFPMLRFTALGTTASEWSVDDGYWASDPRRSESGRLRFLTVTVEGEKFVPALALMGRFGANRPPTLANTMSDQTATAGTEFVYQVPANTFSDADDDTLIYTATQSDGTALPSWLGFDADTRTFSGTPQANDAGTVSVKVTASDGNGGTASGTFNVVVSASSMQQEATTPRVEGTPSIGGDGNDGWSPGEPVQVEMTFDEAVNVDTTNGTPSVKVVLGTDPTNERNVPYASGSGTATLVFEYTLIEADGPHNSVLLTSNSLALNGGTIRSNATGGDAVLDHDGTGVLRPQQSIDLNDDEPQARFLNVPNDHDGESAFEVGLRFSGAPEGVSASDAAQVLQVTGGTVTGARDASHGSQARWEVSVEPDGAGEVTVRLPARACEEANAICIDGRALEEPAEVTVPGEPMTARFTEAPAVHDGSSAMTLRFEFSHAPQRFSYRTVRDALFDVEGGRIEHVKRARRGNNLGWVIRVAPDGNGAVTLASRATTDCEAAHAACDEAGRKFEGGVSLTVPGPASEPSVSISAGSTPVTEGTAASFALARTGDTAAELTVTVAVTESGSVLEGTAPTSVTFAAGSGTATLTVATQDDESVEDAGTVTAAVSAGTGYTVNGVSGTAQVAVEDDDAAPVVNTTSPIDVEENATAVATLAASDADTPAAELSWSIPEGEAGGADAAHFTLTTGGVLTFSSAKDYEAPDDADRNGVYEVTVRISDGANPVDAALEVRLTDADEAAPVLTGAAIDGEILTLAFGETLDTDATPAAGAFAVTVDGNAATVDGVEIADATAVLTLSEAVTATATVTVGYTAPAAPAAALRDAAGNRVASFSGAQVANGTPALPAVSIVGASTPVTEGTAASFALSRTGDTATELTVTVAVTESGSVLEGATPTSVTFASGSGTATLTVATQDDESVEDASTVTGAVSAGTGYTVNGVSGSAEVTVEDDDAAPVVDTASPIEVEENTTAVATLAASDADTPTEDLAWSIPEGEAGGADAAHFALTTEGVLTFRQAKDHEAPDDADTNGVYEVTVRVTDGANPVDSALEVRITDTDDAAPALTGAAIDGEILTLAFGEALDTHATPAASAFAVTVDGNAATVDGVEIASATAVLTLSAAVTATATVTVGYTEPAPEQAGLKDAAGNRVASFTDSAVTNETPAALPVVAIEPGSTPVTEGTAAGFTLTRTGDTAAALTVSVSVGQAGSVLDGTAPSSVIFQAGSASATLSVATENDATHEADGRVSASLVAGTGYELDGARASAGVDVFDDDPAPEPETKSVEVWSTTLTWADLGNRWYGGFEDAFAEPTWTEDGRSFRISYIAYDAGARQLWMLHAGSGGIIDDPGELTLNVGDLAVGPGDAMRTFARANTGTVEGVDSQWEVGQEVTVRLTRASGETQAVPEVAGFSVDDAQVNEASGSPLRFRVWLDAPATTTVSVRYRTSDGTAHAGSDYVGTQGALRFAPGEQSKRVEVKVLEDAHDEGSETMILTLSRPYGSTLTDAEATGTIVNTGPIPRAWITRFGRTVGSQVVEAITGRLEAGEGSQVTVGGLSLLGGGELDERLEEQTLGLPEWDDRVRLDEETRTMTTKELITGSSFHLSTGAREGGPSVSAWGRVAVGAFDATEDELTLDGEVTTGLVGADMRWDRLLGGILVSESRGDGSYRLGASEERGDEGTIEATLTGVYPYLEAKLNERVSAWGLVGVGSGDLTVKRSGEVLETDLGMRMGAVGVRGRVLDGTGPRGIGVNVKTDAMWVATESGRTRGMMGAEGEVSRVRLIVEGEQQLALKNGGMLVPSAEVGLRFDGGDAETGTGLEVGTGLRYSRGAFTIEGQVRGLAAHEEWGASGAIRISPRASGRGLTFSIAPVWGQAGSQAERLWGARDARELEPGGEFEATGRIEAELGYGIGVRGTRGVVTPYTGLSLTEGAGRTLRAGTRWDIGPAAVMGLEWTRQGGADGSTNGIELRAEVRW